MVLVKVQALSLNVPAVGSRFDGHYLRASKQTGTQEAEAMQNQV